MIYTIMIAFVTFAIGWFNGFKRGYAKGELDANLKNYDNARK